MRLLPFLLVSAALAFSTRAETAPQPATPPGQPATGPGGSDYPYAKVKESKHGSGGTEYHLYEPADPAPASAPVIVFIHGWTAIDPWLYGAWIEHLTRRGNIVIHPRYQQSALTPTPEFTPNAIQSVKDALVELAKPGHVTADPTRFAIVGHSVGGLLTANLGALAATSGLPVPRALMSVQPGRSTRPGGGFGVKLEDLSLLPKDALLLCITGERDKICGDADAKRIMKESTSIPADRKNLVILTADAHGKPGLTGSHLAPCSIPVETFTIPEASGEVQDPPVKTLLAAAAGDFDPIRAFFKTPEGRQWKSEKITATPFAETFEVPNAQDFALWRLFDSLSTAAFSGTATVDALGFSPRSLSMGHWGDGTPVKPMRSAGSAPAGEK